MSDLTLRRRIAAPVVMAFLSVMGASEASATVADFVEAQTYKEPNILWII